MLTPPTSALVQLTMPTHTVLLPQTRLCSPCSSLSSADLSPEHSVYQYFLFCSAGTEFHQASTPPHHGHGSLKNSAVPFRAAFAKGIFKNLLMFSESLNWNLHSCNRLVPRSRFPKVQAPQVSLTPCPTLASGQNTGRGFQDVLFPASADTGRVLFYLS